MELKGEKAMKKALDYIYKCEGTNKIQWLCLRQRKRIIMKFLLLLGVSDVELANGALVVRGEGLDEDTVRRNIDEILLTTWRSLLV